MRHLDSTCSPCSANPKAGLASERHELSKEAACKPFKF